MPIDFFLAALHHDVIIVNAAFAAASCIFLHRQVCKSSSVTLLCCITLLAKLMLNQWCGGWLLSLNYFSSQYWCRLHCSLATLAQISLSAAHSAALSCSQLQCRLSSCSCCLPWNVTTRCAMPCLRSKCLSVLLLLLAASASLLHPRSMVKLTPLQPVDCYIRRSCYYHLTCCTAFADANCHCPGPPNHLNRHCLQAHPSLVACVGTPLHRCQRKRFE